MKKGVVQVWECATCKSRYEACIKVWEVLCPKSHLVSKKHMVLIEGDLPVDPKAKKKEAKSG